MKYLNFLMLILSFSTLPLYAMWGRVTEVAVTMMLTKEQPQKNNPPALATLTASFKVIKSPAQKDMAQTEATLSPFLMVENEGVTPKNEITLCYTATVNNVSETLMNHFPLEKKSTKQFETSLQDSSGKLLWLTITCTPKQ